MPIYLRKLLLIYGSSFLLTRQGLLENGKAGLSDGDIAALAVKEKRIIITLDLDFGELYHEKTSSGFGAIILRLRDQRVEQVNKILGQFFRNEFGKNLFADHPHALTVLTETNVRVVY